MMRTLAKVCLAVGLVALMAAPALAQPGGGFGRGGGGLGFLLMNKSVQEELKLDKDQVDKITAALQKVREDHKDDFDKLRDRNLKQEERAEIMKKVTEWNEAALKDLIKPEQMARAKQIQNQQRNLGLFADEEVQKNLKLTDDQKDKIKTLADDLRKDTQEIMQGVRGNPQGFPDAMKKVSAMNTEAMDKVTKMLNADQQKALKDMLGEKFEMKFEPRQPQNRNRNRP